ncbi:Retrovirus-related Pol polyprotein LINE-1 [Zea mays]|uniref:Retrovirus-related Pol polyprotein LINE-1 n=1 Tax=Zea mays TaxID=4577 RepID=A0A1D6MMU8_MAIZE|nr:Retrovirus-related Pol polyprotein LINE-1 [Zea mays]
MATCIRKVASEVFGVTKGSNDESKDTWWWTEDVQKAIKEKKECYRSLFHDRSAVNIERYKMAKKAAKRAVSKAKGRAYDDLYRRLSTKEGEKDVYKIARIRKRKTRDLNQVKCIKDEMDQLLVKVQDIKQRWQRYFNNLFNGENGTIVIQLDDSFDDLNRCFVRGIQESEVKEALKRMKGGKAMGPDCIPIEVWKCLGYIAIVWLTKLFNHIFRSNSMPDEWRSTLVPIFKNKGDIQSYTNYREIKLMSHTMKLWERVIEHRLRGMTYITMNQFDSCPEDQPRKQFFLIRQVMERYKEQKKDLHMVFIDLEKAYDKIPRNLMWRALDKHKVPTKSPMQQKSATEVEGKFYRTAIRHAMLYGAECWPTKRRHIQQLSVAEIRMLRWICGHTRLDRVRNDDIQDRLGVAPIEEKLIQHRLRWFGHVHRRPPEAPVHRGIIGRDNNVKRGRGRPNLIWEKAIKRNLKEWNIPMELCLDRSVWKEAIHVPEP